MDVISWVPMFGEWDVREQDNVIKYNGTNIDSVDKEGKPTKIPSVGNLLSDRTFNEGSIKCKVKFPKGPGALQALVPDTNLSTYCLTKTCLSMVMVCK